MRPPTALPLVVPPGAAGMMPSLAVTYDSASGDGMLGMGFSLTGLLFHHPLPADDGPRRARSGPSATTRTTPSAWTARALSRLVAATGVTEYRTFPNTFTKVLAFPSKNPDQRRGRRGRCSPAPALILEYGGPPDADVMGRERRDPLLARQARDRPERATRSTTRTEPSRGRRPHHRARSRSSSATPEIRAFSRAGPCSFRTSPKRCRRPADALRGGHGAPELAAAPGHHHARPG